MATTVHTHTHTGDWEKHTKRKKKAERLSGVVYIYNCMYCTYIHTYV